MYVYLQVSVSPYLGIICLIEKNRHSAWQVQYSLEKFCEWMRYVFYKFTLDEWLLCFALVLGIGARVIVFPSIPYGFNQDEASSAYDAFALLTSGIDRMGVRFPTVMTSWGSGMQALPSYLQIPFFALLGPTVFASRLPYLLIGFGTLALFYQLLCLTCDRRVAKLGLLLLLTNPWHIMAYRWSHEANLFPALFLGGITLLMYALKKQSKGLLVAAAALIGLCLYTYVASYVIVPAFLVVSAPMIIRMWKGPKSSLLIACTAFVFVALPFFIFLYINTFDQDSLEIWGMTIPHFPSKGRFANAHLLATETPAMIIGRNFSVFARLLITQFDGNFYNALPRFGIIYGYGLPLTILGIIQSKTALTHVSDKRFCFFGWLIAIAGLALVYEVNLNRIGGIAFPLIAFVAIGLASFRTYQRFFSVVLVLHMFWFGSFLYAYFRQLPQGIETEFQQGLYEASKEAVANSTGMVCVTKKANMPYIFVLFGGKVAPNKFSSTVQYENPGEEFQRVRSFDRFLFGMELCNLDSAEALILTEDEIPTYVDYRQFSLRVFDRFALALRRSNTQEYLQ